MKKRQQENLVCPKCNNAIGDVDEFCSDCGTVFGEGVRCKNHPLKEAHGACIICCEPLCQECGNRTNGIFLCNAHCNYEIYQGMARVLGASDAAEVEFGKSCLEQEGLHPFVYSRKASPISMGSPEYTLFRASGEYDGHIINEYKLMVPCQEVKKAERLLQKLELL